MKSSKLNAADFSSCDMCEQVSPDKLNYDLLMVNGSSPLGRLDMVRSVISALDGLGYEYKIFHFKEKSRDYVGGGWVDRNNNYLNIVVPSEGIVISTKGYRPTLSFKGPLDEIWGKIIQLGTYAAVIGGMLGNAPVTGVMAAICIRSAEHWVEEKIEKYKESQRRMDSVTPSEMQELQKYAKLFIPDCEMKLYNAKEYYPYSSEKGRRNDEGHSRISVWLLGRLPGEPAYSCFREEALMTKNKPGKSDLIGFSLFSSTDQVKWVSKTQFYSVKSKLDNARIGYHIAFQTLRGKDGYPLYTEAGELVFVLDTPNSIVISLRDTY